MALSEEELLQQVNILATKTSDNKKMIYNSVEGLNKGLNPDIFYGNNSKIVNAINKVASDVTKLETAIIDVMNKTNRVLSDLNDDEDQQLLEQLQALMEKTTLIEGLYDILSGEHQDKILDIDKKDEGKILSVVIDEITGKAAVEAIELPTINIDELILNSEKVVYEHEELPEVNNVEEALDHLVGKINEIIGVIETPVVIESEEVVYEHEELPEVNNVEEALDHLVGKINEIIGVVEAPIKSEDVVYKHEDLPEVTNMKEAIDHLIAHADDPVTWDSIVNKPQIGNSIQLDDDALILLDDDNDELSLVPLTTDDDIDIILNSLDYLNMIDEDDDI